MVTDKKMNAMNMLFKLILLTLLLCLGILNVSGGGIRVKSNGHGSAWYRFNGKRSNREVSNYIHIKVRTTHRIGDLEQSSDPSSAHS